MIISMKCLNEAKNVKKVISDFHWEPWVSRIIVIDGGSTDGTVDLLKEFKRVEVYIHKWNDDYHDQEIIQSNIQMSYIPYGQIYCIMDFDERMSKEMKNLLAEIDQKGMPYINEKQVDTVSLSRKSYELMRYPDSPYCMFEKDGWPKLSHMIGQYPDFQLRIIKRKLGMHWINSPHHVLFGMNTLYQNINIQADIIHYHGKEDFRDRENIEKKWIRNQIQRKRLGLIADVFEVKPNRELYEYMKKMEEQS